MKLPLPGLTSPTIIFGAGVTLFLLLAIVIAVLVVDRSPVDDNEHPPTENIDVTQSQVMAVDTGVSDQRVLFGQVAAFSGPAQGLGWGMNLGIEAAFHEVNRQGGVHGRQLELRTMDDRYEPELAISRTSSLIQDEGVFALIGGVGTPTSRSAVPVAARAEVPYVAPFTGADFLRESDTWSNVINLRASYNNETEEMVSRLIGELGVERIAVVHQDDSFGRAGYRGVKAALDRREMEIAATGVYPRNTTAVKTALLDVRLSDPEAVIVVGAYEPVAALISWARHIGMDVVFMTLSFAAASELIQELGPFGSGVFVTQVVPSPSDDSLPVVSAYRRALHDHRPDATPDFVSFEGYLAGRLAITGVRACGAEVNRDCFLQSILGVGDLDIDGFRLRFGADDNQGSDAVFLTAIGSDGQYHAISSLKDVVP